MPRILKIETTSRCNARCVFCGHPPGGQDMTWGMYTDIIDAFPDAEVVQPQFWGEPLMWPHIIEGIRYARGSGKRVVFYTNGVLLDELAGDVASAAPNRVLISVDTHLPDVYAALRPPLDFDVLVSGVRRFMALRTGATEVVVRAMRTVETAATMDDTEAFWDAIVDRVIVEDEQPRVRSAPAPLESKPCRMPSFEFVVRADGTCVMCCNDWHSEVVVGHLSEGPREVWQRYREYATEGHAVCGPCRRTFVSSP